MSGPRVTTGSGSVQDYGTPRPFLAAVERRFGRIAIDLAAHAGNAKHERYFAPARFAERVKEGDDLDALVVELARRGATEADARATVRTIDWAQVPLKNGKRVAEIRVPNSDPKALALDSLAQVWAGDEGLAAGGLGFLNPEFSDIAPWARKCAAEAREGARTGLLVPASIGSAWFREHVAPNAETYLLTGSGARLSFDGKDPYPKDLMFAHFTRWGRDVPRIHLWEWTADTVHRTWECRP